MPGYLQSHQISPSPSQNHCLPLFQVKRAPGGGGGASLLLRGLMTLPYGDWGCAANKQCIISGWAVVSWLGLGLGWCMADRALCERDENWHFVECTWLCFSFLCGPLGSGKWPGHQGARGCGEPQSQRGSLILYGTGEVCKAQVDAGHADLPATDQNHLQFGHWVPAGCLLSADRRRS